MQELYSYDACNRLTEQTTIETVKDGLVGTESQKDVTTQPTRETRTSYRYDKQENMVSAVRESGNFTGTQAGLGSGNGSASGNTNDKRQETCKFYYDAFNRQVKTETFDGQVQVNRYDAEGLRHEMEENGRLVQFLFSGREVVAETKEDASTIRYLRGYEIISSDSESARTYYHYVNDENGSVTHVVGEDEEHSLSSSEPQTEGGNATKYQVLNRYEYDAFGNYTVCEEKVANRFGYTGQQYDQATGQYYLRARFYNPVIGRFMQEDTYYGDGLNLYAYCRNLPVGYVDPSGHATLCENGVKKLEEKLKNGDITPKELDALNEHYREVAKHDNKSGSYDPSTNKYPPRTPYAQSECQKVVDIANEILRNIDEENKKANKRLTHPVISIFTHEDGTVSVGFSGKSGVGESKRYAADLQRALDRTYGAEKYTVASGIDPDLSTAMSNSPKIDLMDEAQKNREKRMEFCRKLW